MHTVVVQFEDHASPDRKLGDYEEGDSLLEIAIKNGLPLEHECGGMCTCGTCALYVISGSEFIEFQSKREQHCLSKKSLPAAEFRLACQGVLLPGSGKIIIRLPEKLKS